MIKAFVLIAYGSITSMCEVWQTNASNSVFANYIAARPQLRLYMKSVVDLEWGGCKYRTSEQHWSLSSLGPIIRGYASRAVGTD